MTKLLVGLALLVLSACASVPALAQVCERTWDSAIQSIASYHPQVTELSPAQREAVGRAYNEAEPVTDHVFTAIYFVEAAGRSGVALVVDGCLIDHVPMTRHQLERLSPGA